MAILHPCWPSRNAALLSIPFLLYLLVSFVLRFELWHRRSIGAIWRLANLSSTVALLYSLVCCMGITAHAHALPRASPLDAPGTCGDAALNFRFDTIDALMLLLVTFLGWVIVGYSRAYMAGDPRQHHYLFKLMQTLAAVSLLVVTGNLIVFVAAWIATSLSLHALLTLYPERQPALIAAHKKFLASRLGDLAMIGAVVLLRWQTGSFRMGDVLRRVSTLRPVPASIHIAALLLAAGAMIKCAQLPVHGWLIQVMEAPTPVSALLHAGVVNLGGFMLIVLAPVINTTPAAGDLLAVAGCFTAILASLVMTTRISIKVHLAWSTCAQMGFMLMECGLGLYGLAFLHLLAHSLYKAYAFLGSGGAVRQTGLHAGTTSRVSVSLPSAILSGSAGLLLAALGARLWNAQPSANATGVLCIIIVGFALAAAPAKAIATRSIQNIFLALLSALAVSALYFGYDSLFRKIVSIATTGPSEPSPVLVFCIGCFCLLYAVQTTVRVKPLGMIAAALYPWFYAGFYLDELFTRATFWLWPAKQVRGSHLRDATQAFAVREVNR